MKIFEGKRTIDGLVVTVDGRPLGEHYDVKRFTRFGFEWTYEGDSPQQLALAAIGPSRPQLPKTPATTQAKIQAKQRMKIDG